MYIGICQLQLNIFDCHSLKEKRQITRSLMAKIKNQFNLVVAEVDHHDHYQMATLGAVTINTEAEHCRQLLDKLLEFVQDQQGDFILSDHAIAVENYKLS